MHSKPTLDYSAVSESFLCTVFSNVIAIHIKIPNFLRSYLNDPPTELH